jgi:hypothetical protein
MAVPRARLVYARIQVSLVAEVPRSFGKLAAYPDFAA